MTRFHDVLNMLSKNQEIKAKPDVLTVTTSINTNKFQFGIRFDRNKMNWDSKFLKCM